MTAPTQATTETVQGAEALRKLFTEVWRYKWVIPVVAAIVTGAVATYVTRLPREYESSATIQYDPQPTQPLGKAIDEQIGAAWDNYEFYQTQNWLLRSRALAERIVRTYHLHEDPDFLDVPPQERANFRPIPVERAAQLLIGKISIKQIPETRVVQITVRDLSQDRAQMLANAVAEEHIQKSLEDRLGTSTKALEWLGSQMETLRQEVDGAEMALYKYREEHKTLSASLAERQKIIASQLEHYSGTLTDIHTKRIQTEAHLATIREFVTDGTQPISVRAGLFGDDETVRGLRTAVGGAQINLDKLSLTYGPAHPAVRTAASELAAMTRELEAYMLSILTGTEAELRELNRAESGIRGALADANRQGLELSQEEARYVRLDRDRESKIRLYEMLMERAAQTDLQQALNVANARVVDRALRPTTAVSPKVRQAVIMGAIVGVLLGLLAAFGISLLDNKVRGVSDLEVRGVTILGVLPSLASAGALPSPYGRRRKRAKKDGHDLENPDLIVHYKPRSTVAECARTVRTNITFQAADQPLRALAITSALPRDGKTTVSMSLAITLAQSGKRVLLIDTDLRKPRLHRAFGIPSGAGITSVLAGESTLAEVVRESIVPNLSFLQCGPIPPNPSELLHTRRFADIVSELKRTYDIVVLDTPPLGAVTDPAIISTLVDGTLLVVRSRVTSRASVDAALRQLGSVNARLVGAVVNDVDLTDSSYGPYYAYYRGYYADETQSPPTPGKGATGLSTP